MAHSKQAKKRVRQNERRREDNKAIASVMRTEIKRVLAAVESGDMETAKGALPGAMRRIDKAAKRGVIHDNTAARRKSRLERAINRAS